ncbi:MAG: YeeE/YedE family protein [Bacteroidetes bacterium]|nr:YeeE/YedE family protein [Bacteroidota bacterium]
MLDYLREPWPWHVSGVVIALIMFFLLFAGKSFGVSSNFRTMCAACGAGNNISFFKFDWKAQKWNLMFLVGTFLGGWLSANFLASPMPVDISQDTIADLALLGISAPETLQPMEIFSFDFLFTLKGFLVLSIGGLLIGFGSRYGGGCTSGHAISGLSNFQLPSLLAVIGFFIGGLIMTHLLLPLIF